MIDGDEDNGETPTLSIVLFLAMGAYSAVLWWLGVFSP